MRITIGMIRCDIDQTTQAQPHAKKSMAAWKNAALSTHLNI
jgi:hypothetical protein